MFSGNPNDMKCKSAYLILFHIHPCSLVVTTNAHLFWFHFVLLNLLFSVAQNVRNLALLFDTSKQTLFKCRKFDVFLLKIPSRVMKKQR